MRRPSPGATSRTIPLSTIPQPIRVTTTGNPTQTLWNATTSAPKLRLSRPSRNTAQRPCPRSHTKNSTHASGCTTCESPTPNRHTAAKPSTARSTPGPPDDVPVVLPTSDPVPFVFRMRKTAMLVAVRDQIKDGLGGAGRRSGLEPLVAAFLPDVKQRDHDPALPTCATHEPHNSVFHLSSNRRNVSRWA